MIRNIALSVTLAFSSSVVLANPVSHSHGDRSHIHPLPKIGIAHTHGSLPAGKATSLNIKKKNPAKTNSVSGSSPFSEKHLKKMNYLTNKQQTYLYENLGELYQYSPNLRDKARKNLENFLDTVSINALTHPFDRTILFHAVTSPFSPHNKDTIKFVRHLISLKANVNIADIANVTPLHEAVKSGSLELVKLLVESGANISARDNFGRTAISLAIFMNKEKILKYLKSKRQ